MIKKLRGSLNHIINYLNVVYLLKQTFNQVLEDVFLCKNVELENRIKSEHSDKEQLRFL